uniref:Serine threonine protein kinase n=2 Tax=Tetraselmis sp. GSL018 TaxID=582737 RepID=A0A061RTS5_9CHLO
MSSICQKALKARLGMVQNVMAPEDPKDSSSDIVRSFGFFEERGEVVFVLEYCARTDLVSYLQGRTVDEANVVIEIVQPILRCLQHLHTRGYAHGNVTPQNVLLNADGFIKIGDFDCLTWQPQTKAQKKLDSSLAKLVRLQTPNLEFMAPELVGYHFPAINMSASATMAQIDIPYTPAVDIWSFGCMVYELLTGKLPFNPTREGLSEDDEALETARRITEDDIPVPLCAPISDEAVSFIRFAMQKDLSLRPSAEDLMLHPWVQKYAATEVSTMFIDPPPMFEEISSLRAGPGNQASLTSRVTDSFMAVLATVMGQAKALRSGSRRHGEEVEEEEPIGRPGHHAAGQHSGPNEQPSEQRISNELEPKGNAEHAPKSDGNKKPELSKTSSIGDMRGLSRTHRRTMTDVGSQLQMDALLGLTDHEHG